MSDLQKWQELELLNRIRLVVPDAEFSPEESFNGKPIVFDDSCGCWSEWTTESCRFECHVTGTVEKKDEQATSQVLNSAVENWVKGNLKWDGCECCGNEIWVWVRFYPKKAASVISS